jgi:hypothetical protein
MLASSERVFSSGGNVVTKNRNWLSGDSVQEIVCLRDWGVITEEDDNSDSDGNGNGNGDGDGDGDQLPNWQGDHLRLDYVLATLMGSRDAHRRRREQQGRDASYVHEAA